MKSNDFEAYLNDEEQHDTQIWVDDLSDKFGDVNLLYQFINSTKISGLNVNPGNLLKLINSNESYKNKLLALKVKEIGFEDRYDRLFISDLQKACDSFLPLYKSSKAEQGYVSFYISPRLSHYQNAIVMRAKKIWRAVNRPNLLITIPATPNGIEAIQKLTQAGINTHATLIFSFKQLASYFYAYIKGLFNRNLQHMPLNQIHSVASIPLQILDDRLNSALPEHLQNTGAINFAKGAYLIHYDLFNDRTFNFLKEVGAKPANLMFLGNLFHFKQLKGKGFSVCISQQELKGLDAALETAKPLTDNIYESYQAFEEINKHIKLQVESGELLENQINNLVASFNEIIKKTR